MKRNLAPSVADIVFLVAAPLAAIARTLKLTHSDGDLPAHIRMGEAILSTGRIPALSLASFTASDEPMLAHAWLGEVILAALFSAGGLALISVVTGLIVGLTHATIALWLRSRGADPRWALAAAFISLAVSSTHWLARPHMFTILAVALTLWLIESPSKKRLILIGALFAVWANLHGGWAYGSSSFSQPSPASCSRRRSPRCNEPAGWQWLATISQLSPLRRPRPCSIRSVWRCIAKFSAPQQTPSWRDKWGSSWLPIFNRRQRPVPSWCWLRPLHCSHWPTGECSLPHLAIVVVSLLLALRSFRNMALFGVSAWPLIALHLAATWRSRGSFPLFSVVCPSRRSGTSRAVCGSRGDRDASRRTERRPRRRKQLIRSGFSGKIFPWQPWKKCGERGSTAAFSRRGGGEAI